MNLNYNDFSDTCVSQRQNTMNERAYSRNIPSQKLQPSLNARPVLTKYSILPIVDPRKAINVPLEQMGTFNMSQTFTPGTSFGPWSGYASQVNDESILRNQIYALQDCPQATYVPSSKSDLYKVHWQNHNMSQSALQVQNQFPTLYRNERFAEFNPGIEGVGNNFFNNCTRQQVKDTSTNCAQ